MFYLQKILLLNIIYFNYKNIWFRETIFGYKDLKIKLYYTPGWFRTYFRVEYKHKIEPKDMVVAVCI